MLVALIAGCGKKTDSSHAKDDAAGTKPAVAPLALPALGVDRINRFNFSFGDGEPAYAKAVAAAKTKAWPAVRQNCEAVLAKDPMHLDAHRLLATALAQAGEHAAAVDHLVAAIAADYYRYAAGIATDPELKEFLATPHGQAVTSLAQQIGAEYAKRIKAGLWLVGRRRPFSWPDKPGVQGSTTRGELYAYDRETKRFFRLSHTDHQVAGFLPSHGGTEVALLGFDKVDRPKDETPPLIARSWVLAIDTIEWKPLGPKVTLPSAREVAVGYGAGDELVVSTAPATGRWTVGDATASSVDRTTGKLTKVASITATPRIVLTVEESRVIPAPEDGFAGDPPVAASLKTPTGTTIQVPESGQAALASFAASPDKARVAFATAVDPCAKDAAPSLYVADAKSGALKHLLTARSRFATRWVDATTLAYEDGDGAIRLWDAISGREAIRLDDKGGLALAVLSPANGPLCKQAPPGGPAHGLRRRAAASRRRSGHDAAVT